MADELAAPWILRMNTGEVVLSFRSGTEIMVCFLIVISISVKKLSNYLFSSPKTFLVLLKDIFKLN